ncbi:hypothetical protein CLAIMM_04698 isoform 1 [Cladophialophora immunda]|nr:hypothetical protein CLAIMM_04698 isoform 1 [Cladophialophora immunda]
MQLVLILSNSKTELQAELDQLKKQVGTGTPEQKSQSQSVNNLSTFGNFLGLPAAPTPTGAYATPQVVSFSPRSLGTSTNVSAPPAPDPSHGNVLQANTQYSTTRPQTVQDVLVDAQDIDECFELFFEKNLPYLPIFDQKLQPNDCYGASPFLFWTILAIGSRRYSKDPTLILLLAPKVLELAKAAIFSLERVLPTIQALVLLCTWQMPIDTLQKDVTPQLAGAMIQLATNVGLHVYGSVQDFTRVPLKYDSQQRSFRTRLWSMCLYTCQRVNNSRGLPPLVLTDTYSHEGYKENPLATLSPTVRFQRKLNHMLSEGIVQIDRDALSKRPDERNMMLGPTIDGCLSKLAALSTECPTKQDQLMLRIAELQVSACHLIAPSSAIGQSHLVKMYTDACAVIELASELDREQGMAEYGSTNVNMNWNLAAFIILRVGKSHVREALDLKRGQKCYFSAINLNKRQSVRSDDISARATMILSQLWTSKVVIKQPDGTPDSLWLRCRNRLGVSVTFDCFWLWRQEFGGQPNPYEGVEDEKATTTAKPVVWSSPATDSVNMMMGIGWSPDTVFQDFQWPIFDEFLVPLCRLTYTANEFQGIYRGKKQHDEDFEQVLERAEAAGCAKVVLTTMSLKGAHQNLAVCHRFPGTCYMTLGVHPYHASELYDGTSSLEELSSLGRSLLDQTVGEGPLVAFGEIGLDYFYLDRAAKGVQRRAFVEQLELATAFDLPLFLHVRDSYDDFVDIVRPFLPRLPRRGVVHSFAGTKEEMLGLVELGFDVSVNGVSFRAEAQLGMVRAIPLDRLQLETDAPWCEIPAAGPAADYLKDAPPLPLSRKPSKFVKGDMVKGRNESCVIERVARVVAGVKGVSLTEVVDAAWRNSVTMFGLGAAKDQDGRI